MDWVWHRLSSASPLEPSVFTHPSACGTSTCFLPRYSRDVELIWVSFTFQYLLYTVVTPSLLNGNVNPATCTHQFSAVTSSLLKFRLPSLFNGDVPSCRDYIAWPSRPSPLLFTWFLAGSSGTLLLHLLRLQLQWEPPVSSDGVLVPADDVMCFCAGMGGGCLRC